MKNIKEPQVIAEAMKLHKREDELSAMNVEKVQKALASAATDFRIAFDQTSDVCQRVRMLGDYVFEHSPEVREGMHALIAMQKATNEMFNALSSEQAMEATKWMEQENDRLLERQELHRARLEKGHMDVEKLRAADFNNAGAISPELVGQIVAQCGMRLYITKLNQEMMVGMLQ